MPLYLNEGKLLTVDGALAASEDCCCDQDCKCCGGDSPPSSFTVRVAGIAESVACDAATPADNCRTLNRDYVFNATECAPVGEGNTTCAMVMTQAVGYQVCGLTSLTARLTLTTTKSFGTYYFSILFQVFGKLSGNDVVIIESSASDSSDEPPDCTTARQLGGIGAAYNCWWGGEDAAATFQPG